jgi:hypothetical protein
VVLLSILTPALTNNLSPAFIENLLAAPSEVVVGEMVTISAKVTTLINETVPDDTEVRFHTNVGGRMVPETARTSGGRATSMLLTSSAHVGAYEVVAEVDSPWGVLLKTVVIIARPPLVKAPKTNPLNRVLKAVEDSVGYRVALVVLTAFGLLGLIVGLIVLIFGFFI